MTTLKNSLAAGLLALAVAAAPFTFSAPAVAGTHHVAIHVDENDKARMTQALNNAKNIEKYYQEQEEEVVIEIVAIGPGVTMLRSDATPVGDLISTLSQQLKHISFAACGNTLRGITQREGKAPPLLDQVKVVPSGAVRLMELQEQGYSYLRP